MGYIEPSAWESPSKRCSSQVLVCVDPGSLGFLRSHPALPKDESIEFLRSSDAVFDQLWCESDRVAAVVLDQCSFDFEELLYASLNHTHVTFIVRSSDLGDSIWFQRYARQPNIKLPCSDFMMWTHVFSSSAIKLWSDSA